MLEIVIKFLMAIILVISGVYIVSNLTKQKFEMKAINIILLLTVPIVTILAHKIEYTFLASILPYLTLIVIYRYIFKLGFSQSVLITSIMMGLIFISDIVVSSIFVKFVNIAQLRSTWYMIISANLLVSVFACLLCKIKLLKSWCEVLLAKVEEKRYLSTIIFAILLIVVMTSLFYRVYDNYEWNRQYIVNLIVMLTFFIMTYIFIKEQARYDKLNHEYDSLFEHVQTFEEWIELEQVNRHEFKNQLVTLKSFLNKNNKKAQDYIDSILKEQLEIDGRYVEQLKNIPKCGLKGLIYYKIVQAKKSKINITAEIGDNVSKFIKDLDENEIKLLCRLVGIYCDNAIEATKMCKKKKNVFIEIYLLSNKLNIVIMNTFEKDFDLKEINKKGVSSKGKGRGNGLYFAQKILKKNKRFSGVQSVINNYYNQKIIIEPK